MSIRLRYGDVKTICARVLNMNTTDTRLPDYVVRAQERLVYKGKWVGTIGRFRVCVQDSCLTWPREVETIETWAFCTTPGRMYSQWYEFLSTGPGQLGEDSQNGRTLIDRGDACTHTDTDGGGLTVLSLYAEVTETTTTKFIVQFYNHSGQWVRTQDGSGNWVDGQQITVPLTSGTYTDGAIAPNEASIVRIIKPATNGPLRLYEKTVATGARKELGFYQADETVPVYRRSLIPNLKNVASNGDGTCSSTSVTIMGKLRPLPVTNDNDFLVISHRDALRLECQAIKKEEDDLWDEAAVFSAKAKKLLDEQLDHWRGDGIEDPVAVKGKEEWGPAVENLI